MPSSSHRPRKRFGQHFLHDPGVLARIVHALGPASGDAVLEIGPGEGALTRLLLERLPALCAIEIDRDLAAQLAAEFPADRLQLHCADALEFDYARLPPGMRLVGNLPYNISTPLLFRLAEYGAHFRDLHFMLQREVVDRMVAAPATAAYGRLSVMLQLRYVMRRLFLVPPGAFRPPPKVESAVVSMLPRAGVTLPAGLAELVRAAFSGRRKMLRNSLPLPEETYARLGVDPRLRAEALAPADFLRLALALRPRVR